jgi:hypothetical protein
MNKDGDSTDPAYWIEQTRAVLAEGIDGDLPDGCGRVFIGGRRNWEKTGKI